MKALNFITLYFILNGCGNTVIENPFNQASNTPLLFAPGNISTERAHESINYISSDIKTIYFSRSDKNFETSTLYSSRFSDGKWGQAQTLSFSGKHYDANLHLSPNEEVIFFTSKRPPNKPGISKEWNIWKVGLNENDEWGEPEVLPAPINSEESECCMTMNSDGLTFFASDRDGSWDIYECKYANDQFLELRKLSTKVNSENGEWPAYVSDDGDILLISSIRKSGYGGDDLYVVGKKSGSWIEPVLMDSTINTSGYEDNPMLSADGKYLLFSSWKDTEFTKGVSNIYVVKAPVF